MANILYKNGFPIKAVVNGKLVDVQEVRHGRWVIEAEFKYKRGGRNTEAKQIFGTEWRTMQRLKCSVCGMVVLVDDTIKYEYCPHCGARCEE